MNPRNAINFLRTPTGALVGFGVLFIVALIFVKGFYDPNRAKSKPSSATPLEKMQKPQLVQTIERALVPFNPPSNGDPKIRARMDESTQQQRIALTPISLFPDSPSSDLKPLSKFYAPYGRLIPCELIVTIDSSSIQTPIIGLITEDIYHDGRLIIPAGTEVHGSAQADRKRERIASNGEWILVWQTGEELHLGGIALDREKDTNGEGWGITDGSAGLRGHVLKTDNLAEVKLFAATFLSGAASAVTETRQTIFGTQLSPSLQNAPLQGAQSVLAAYAQQILDTIQRDGFYVRVPAGKEFYLYVTQTIDESEALVGGTRLLAATHTNEPAASPELAHFQRSYQ